MHLLPFHPILSLYTSTLQRHVKNECLLVPEYCGNGCGEQIARRDVSTCHCTSVHGVAIKLFVMGGGGHPKIMEGSRFFFAIEITKPSLELKDIYQWIFYPWFTVFICARTIM